jgi:hypothetical protein
MFKYHGRDTGNRWRIVPPGRVRPWGGRRRKRYRRRRGRSGWIERGYYFRQGGRCQNLDRRRVYHARFRAWANYRNTGGRWRGWRRGNHLLRVEQAG